jgi:hypothetical protein
MRRASLHKSKCLVDTGSSPSCRRTSGGYTYMRRASLHMSGCLVGVRSIMKENFRRIYLHEESIIARVWVSSGYRLSSIVKENLRRIYLHEESIIAHVWVSNGYRLSSIMQENFNLSLKYMTFIAVNSKII